MYAKGKLLIIGGAEDMGDKIPSASKKNQGELQRYEILRELFNASRNKKIEVITSGSRYQEEVRQRYEKAFRDLGYLNSGFIQIEDKMEAREKIYLDRIEQADGIFFTGGDQFRLATILGGTPLIDRIRERYVGDKTFIVAGTSAGAMVMSSIMITEGGEEEALMESDLKTSSGLGFLQNCIIDTHFIKRGRFARLAHAIIINPDQLGVGLGEDTALIIKNGSEAECRGSGMVVIIDGKSIRQTNISTVKEDDAVYVENLKVHLLVKNCRFSIKTRKLYNPTLKD
ncbi:cyanophycinase [Legionella taurinensis]|uniref:Cyanophycinase n=1 Tax=Legionella taurinensis TaxID=70611 RepID=A0A3A5LET3_9GAMM|nr:cyanophycinase [Legionella taurinensis]MDX1838781.1 cyanophycinase [Legionella taurinensis]PUT38645.1 cyanophycinase [Legionella taurinensis]PUT39843.1 cyanophycinase [Legionella taurinensis]PUT41835.1 cyanophycinase [Legionella taurinensis]PUT45330.1 cyanophycinase [Legionella taurinensis]